MKLLVFVDMHGSLKALKEIIKKSKDADMLLCCGDLTIFEQNLTYFFRELDKLNKRVLLINGNHESPANMKRLCINYKNLIFIHNNPSVYEDFLFIGHGGGGFSLKDANFEAAAKNFSRIIKQNKGKKIILATHAPPYGTSIDLIMEEHCGNKSIREFILKNKIDYSFAGHLHETAGRIDRLKGTLLCNPGPYGMIFEI